MAVQSCNQRRVLNRSGCYLSVFLSTILVAQQFTNKHCLRKRKQKLRITFKTVDKEAYFKTLKQLANVLPFFRPHKNIEDSGIYRKMKQSLGDLKILKVLTCSLKSFKKFIEGETKVQEAYDVKLKFFKMKIFCLC